MTQRETNNNPNLDTYTFTIPRYLYLKIPPVLRMSPTTTGLYKSRFLAHTNVDVVATPDIDCFEVTSPSIWRNKSGSLILFLTYLIKTGVFKYIYMKFFEGHGSPYLSVV